LLPPLFLRTKGFFVVPDRCSTGTGNCCRFSGCSCAVYKNWKRYCINIFTHV